MEICGQDQLDVYVFFSHDLNPFKSMLVIENKMLTIKIVLY